jgi:hypothetical protein
LTGSLGADSLKTPTRRTDPRDVKSCEGALVIDVSWVGHTFAPLDVDIERSRLRQFAKAVGEQRREYIDPEAARAVGWPDLPVPLTFFFCLEMEQPDPWGFLKELGVDLARVLHGEQTFEYHATAWAGERLTLVARISDVYSKREGALEFVVKDTTVTNQHHSQIADLRSVLVVRNG